MSVFMTIFGPKKFRGLLEVCCLESSRGILLKVLGLELNAIWTSSQMAPLMAKTMAAWNVNRVRFWLKLVFRGMKLENKRRFGKSKP